MSRLGISRDIPIMLELEGATENEVIREMIHSLADHAEVKDVEALETAVRERQKVHPPLLGNGVALPHARTTAVSELMLAIGRCPQPVLFGPEEIPVRLVFLYGVPVNCITEYLAAVARLTGLLKTPGMLNELLIAPDEATFRALLS